jgi:hypothetical protein
MKMLAMGAQLFHAEGRTDRRMDRRIDTTKLIVAFRNFVNAPKNCEAKWHTLGPVYPFSNY